MKRTVIETAREDGGAIARAEIRWTEGSSAKAALRLLVDVVLEIVVQARQKDGTHAPAQVASREQDGSRWNG